MKCWVDLGPANTGLDILGVTYYARLLSDGSAADFSGASFSEPDATNLPGLYIFDAPNILEDAKGKVFESASVWGVLEFSSSSGVSVQDMIDGGIALEASVEDSKNAAVTAALGQMLGFFGIDWSEDDALDISVTGDIQTGDSFKIACFCAWTDEIGGGCTWAEPESYEWWEVFQYTHGTGAVNLHPSTDPGNRHPYMNLSQNDIQLVGFCWDSPPRDTMPALEITITPKTGINAGESMVINVPAMEGQARDECPIFDFNGNARRKDYPFTPMVAAVSTSGGGGGGTTTAIGGANPAFFAEQVGGGPSTKTVVQSAETGDDLWVAITRMSTGLYLDGDDETFKAYASCVTPFIAMTEDSVLKGVFKFQTDVAEWADGWYVCSVYRQSGGSPDPSSDELLSVMAVEIRGDISVSVAATIEVGSKLVEDLFTEVKVALNDAEGNIWEDSQLVVFYNRTLDEVAAVLRHIGAEIAMKDTTITGDGTSQRYQLPSDFAAFVPETVLPRTPIDATSDYGHGKFLTHVERRHPLMMQSPSSSGDPRRFCLEIDGITQYIKFDCIFDTGHFVDALYFPTLPYVTEATIGSTYTPWLSLLDPLIRRTIEEFCKEGREFTSQKHELWRARAEADAIALLGLRKVKDHVVKGSMWKGLPR